MHIPAEQLSLLYQGATGYAGSGRCCGVSGVTPLGNHDNFNAIIASGDDKLVPLAAGRRTTQDQGRTFA
jgi:hypothetical protein